MDRLSIETAIRIAERRLARTDPVMRRLISRHGRCPLADREFEPFHMLANSIISQQLSTKAAATIKQRVGVIVGVPFQIEKILAVSPEQLRSAGLSAAKARYIRELAERVSDGRLNFAELVACDDESVIEKLIEVPGIGRWTAEMFLLFGLKRLDVLALGDAGLQRAARLLYGKKRKSLALLPRVAEAWRPYRSIASWYLWRSLEDF
ncbi:MAG TPA: DNA-3-methyladenine glycosylase 2 family protein [Candidatus Binatia bacterium]|mgnify:CR=1 FL=1|nr:DNA-3-methyladenine glycosylase 2 family protein [Candidatus Binatia bacterium]